MKTKLSLRKPALVITLALVLSLLVSVTAYAQTADETIVQLFRLGGNYAGIKITFPNDITNARYLGMIAGKGFDCEITPPNVAYCIGVYPRSTGPSILHLIDLETKETILKRAVYPPLPRGFGIQELEPSDYLPSSSSNCSCR